MSKVHTAANTSTLADDTHGVRHTDVLIIGAGLAGLSTALALPQTLHVTILSKAALDVCSSHYAQGGIAASLDAKDCTADHIADTLIAGAGLCEAKNTTEILSSGEQAVQWLCEQGVPFTRLPKQHAPAEKIATLDNFQYPHEEDLETAALQTSDLHLTKEGGHGCRRVAHADDATGRHIMEALVKKAQAASNITILPYHEAFHLLKNTDNHCRGALVFDHVHQRQLTLHSRAVVLASGGLGQLFKRASAPNVCVGDGVMMAWQAGCRLANLEFIQFHPTGLALGDSSFLISEALRGEGGRLYCPQTGKRFMLEIDTRAELAPRDIVARAIAEQISINGLGYVHLDVSHLPAAFLRAHFPQIYQTLLDLGIDITTDPIPVAPTAHYSCGGVVTSANGLTDVIGLYAAGEVAYTGLHGANRLASNSLLECVVVGRHIAADIPRYLHATKKPDATSIYTNSEQSIYDIWTPPMLADYQRITLPSPIEYQRHANDHHNVNVNVGTSTNTEIAGITTQLKALMTSHLGITRSAAQLEQALGQICQWQQQLGDRSVDHIDTKSQDHVISYYTLPYVQLTRQLQLAALIIQSAYQRHESRGGHYRQDYPNLASKPLTSVIEPPSLTAFATIDDIDTTAHITTADVQKTTAPPLAMRESG